MKNILLLGGDGFIGKNIIEKFLGGNYHIIVIDKSNDYLYSKYSNNKRIKLIEGELSNIEFVNEVISTHHVEIVIHLISTLIPSSNVDDFHNDLFSVVYPTFKLIDFLDKKNIKIVFFSSGGTIYGNSNKPLQEIHKLAPINYYGYSKLMIERYIQFRSRVGKLKFLIIRPSNVFGKHQRINSSQGFIAITTKRIIEGKEIEIWGDGRTVRDYIYVSDLVDAVDKLLINNVLNEVVNIGSGVGTNLLEIVNIIERLLNKQAKLVFKEKRSVDLDYMVLNIDKIKSFVSFNPMPVEEGIKLFINSLTNDF